MLVQCTTGYMDLNIFAIAAASIFMVRAEPLFKVTLCVIMGVHSIVANRCPCAIYACRAVVSAEAVSIGVTARIL